MVFKNHWCERSVVCMSQWCEGFSGVKESLVEYLGQIVCENLRVIFWRFFGENFREIFMEIFWKFLV